MNGGDGNDVIQITTVDRAAFGGNGDDSSALIGAGRGVHPLIDGNGRRYLHAGGAAIQHIHADR